MNSNRRHVVDDSSRTVSLSPSTVREGADIIGSAQDWLVMNRALDMKALQASVCLETPLTCPP